MKDLLSKLMVTTGIGILCFWSLNELGYTLEGLVGCGAFLFTGALIFYNTYKRDYAFDKLGEQVK